MAIPSVHPNKDCSGLFVNRSYWDNDWKLSLDFPIPRVDLYWEFGFSRDFLFKLQQNDDVYLNILATEYLVAVQAAGLCTPHLAANWNSVMGDVQSWGPKILQIMHSFNYPESVARSVVSDCSKQAWRYLMLQEYSQHAEHKSQVDKSEAERPQIGEQPTKMQPAAPLRPENQRELIEQLENVRSQFFYTAPEQIDKEVGRLNSTRLGLLHSIYNVAGVVMAPAEISTLVSASHILSTKISGLMQTRKRLAEQAKDKQSGPLDTSL